MGFGEQTEDRDLPPYIVIGTSGPGDTPVRWYVAKRASLERESLDYETQAEAQAHADLVNRRRADKSTKVELLDGERYATRTFTPATATREAYDRTVDRTLREMLRELGITVYQQDDWGDRVTLTIRVVDPVANRTRGRSAGRVTC